MTRQTDHPHIQAEVFAAELGAQPQAALLQQLGLQGQVAEGMAGGAALGRQVIQILGRGQFDGFQIGFGRSAADDHRQVIGRTGRRSQALHLGCQKRHQVFGLRTALVS